MLLFQCAVIQLPSQTLLLSVTEKAARSSNLFFFFCFVLFRFVSFSCIMLLQNFSFSHCPGYACIQPTSIQSSAGAATATTTAAAASSAAKSQQQKQRKTVGAGNGGHLFKAPDGHRLCHLGKWPLRSLETLVEGVTHVDEQASV